MLIFASYTFLYMSAKNHMSIGIIFLIFALIALGELFIGPAVWSVAGRYAPDAMKGRVMGFVTLGYAGANYLGGFLSRAMAVTEKTGYPLFIYKQGFLRIMMIACVCMILAWSLAFFRKNKKVQ